MSAGIVDTIILYRILKLLATPITESPAYHLGIINQDGKQIRAPHTTKEKEAFTLLNRLVFRLQRLITRNNTRGESELKRMAASSYLVRECYEKKQEPLNLELLYKEAMDVISDEDIREFQEALSKTLIPFSIFMEDAPINNSMATPGIERPETLLGDGKMVTRNLKKKRDKKNAN